MAKPILSRIEANVERIPFSGCWIWMGYVDKHGYGRISVPGEPGARAYRVAWESKNRPLARGECVLHRCDTPACCNPEHLFVGTRLENNVDKARKGRGARKLTNEEVVRIRSDNRRLAEIASDYGVSLSLICAIRNNRIRVYA